MIMSIAYAAVYILLGVVFVYRKGKALPKAASAAFMLGIPLLSVLIVIQARLFAGEFESDAYFDSLAEIVSHAKYTIILPSIIFLIGAAFVVAGVVRFLKIPCENCSDLVYHKKSAGIISGWGIVVSVLSLVFGIGFIVSLVDFIIELLPTLAGTLALSSVVLAVIMCICVVCPLFIAAAIPLGIYVMACIAASSVVYLLPQIVGMIVFLTGFGIVYAEAAALAVCAAVHMKKSGIFSTKKAVLMSIASFIPIANIFSAASVRKSAYGA